MKAWRWGAGQDGGGMGRGGASGLKPGSAAHGVDAHTLWGQSGAWGRVLTGLLILNLQNL